jgi:phage shock protein PspC (stress-responsive transcriptional regulator)
MTQPTENPTFTDQQAPPQQPPSQQPTGKRLVRRSDDKMVAGVCSGVADYLGVDVTLVRVLTVLGAVFGLGSLVVAYVVMWVLVPEE